MPESVVYLIQCGEHYKIGRSTDIRARLKAMQRFYPLPLVLCHVWPTSLAPAMERGLHQQFKAQRVQGEWFQLGCADVARLVATPAWTASDLPPVATRPHRSKLPSSPLATLLIKQGISRPSILARRAKISRQYAHMLWHGQRCISRAVAQRLHTEIGLSLRRLIMAVPTP